MRLGALLPRALVIVFAWVLATAAFTFAADRSNIIGPSPAASTTPAQTPELTVPAVDGQAFVFAKGILEDAGFAWRVSGPVHGYAANTVLAQSPAAGTKVVDTGAPTVTLRLVRGSYAEQGAPEDTSSYMGTSIKLPGLASVPVTPKPAKQPAKAAKPKPAKPAKPKPAEPAKPAKPAKRAKPHAKPKKPAKPSKPAKPVKHANKPAASRSRPPAFTVPGAPKEPLDEITLPARADRLAAWIATKPKLTNANASRWLYQHSWIVTGAKFGWWHGDRALVKLIAVDRSVERIWGLGHRSEAVARAALAQVRRAER